MTIDSRISGYDTIAPFYDRYTEHPDFPDWIRRVERVARRHGFGGGRVLDAACGTGASLEPLIELGYEVTGLDVCAEMLAQARHKLGGDVPLVLGDVRRAPDLGPFDLITWLGDACNCLLGDDDLESALRSLAANLAPAGLLVFDASTLSTFGGVFAETHSRRSDDLSFRWEGHTANARRGGLATATLSVFSKTSPASPLAVSEHVQRHHPRARVLAALEAAGLELRDCLGQEASGLLTPAPVEGQPKRLYVTAKPYLQCNERRSGAQDQAPAEAGYAGVGSDQARLANGGARSDSPPGAADSS